MTSINIKRMNRVSFHILFWVVSVFVFAFIFRLKENVDTLDVVYSLFFHCSIIFSIYINFLCIKKLFEKRIYSGYLLLLLINVVVTVILNQYTFDVIVDIILPDYYFISQFNYLEIALIAIIYLVVTSAIKLSKSWFDLQRISRIVIESEKEKIDSELQNLKSQINPHFLFNSLNVVYSLSLKNDQETT